MRYLSIDFGAKRTGLAVGDDGSGIASPVGVIQTANAEERLRQVGRAIAEQEPGALVVGVPLGADGSAGSAGSAAGVGRAFAETLRRRFGLPVFEVDERLSSADADEQMGRSGLTHGQKKARRDALAAAVILRRFFASGTGRPGD
ncbi:MAG: Holliday junction resolvase RuvX [Planctomycetota bacterium]